MVADVYALQGALQIKTVHANEIVVVAPDEALVAYVYSAPHSHSQVSSSSERAQEMHRSDSASPHTSHTLPSHCAIATPSRSRFRRWTQSAMHLKRWTTLLAITSHFSGVAPAAVAFNSRVCAGIWRIRLSRCRMPGSDRGSSPGAGDGNDTI